MKRIIKVDDDEPEIVLIKVEIGNRTEPEPDTLIMLIT